MREILRQIVIENLQWHAPEMRQSTVLLSGFTWRLEAGSISGILGAKASQRSMLLRLLAGLERPVQGKMLAIENGGEPLRWPEESRVGVAYLPPPGAEVFTATTVGEELRLGVSDPVLEKENLSVFYKFVGRSFESSLSRSVWELSEGERRLLLFQAQILTQPAVWICDEPAALLDGNCSRGVYRLLHREAREGAIVVIASAEVYPLLDLADRVLVLTESGSPAYSGDSYHLPAQRAADLGWNPRLGEAARRAKEGEDIEETINFLLRSVDS